MNANMRIYIAYTPADYRAVFATTLPLCHMAYEMGSGRHLMRRGVGQNVRRGLLLFTDSPWFEGGNDDFCKELIRECTSRAYEGAVADFEEEVNRDKATLLMAAADVLSSRKLNLYVPESYGMAVPNAKVMISSAISGGTLNQRLTEAITRYGEGRVVLEVQRLTMDFSLPSPNGLGRDLTAEELNTIMHENGAESFFSNDLCAHYFTYRSDNEHHFVIYDTAASIKRKLDTAASAGISTAFVLWSEVADWIGEIV